MRALILITLLCLTGCGPLPSADAGVLMCGELPCTGDPCGPKGPWGEGGDPQLCRESTADAGTVWPS